MISSNEEYLYNKLDLIEIDFDSSTPEQDRDLVWKSLSNCYYSDMDESDISLFYNKKFISICLVICLITYMLPRRFVFCYQLH